MTDDKTQRVAYMKGFAAGHRKFEAEFETLLEVSEGRLREINKLKATINKLGWKVKNTGSITGKDWMEIIVNGTQ